MSEVNDAVSIVELKYLGGSYYGQQVWPQRMKPMVFLPQDMVSDTGSGSWLQTRNRHKVMSYPAYSVGSAAMEGVLPQSYAGGGLKVKIWFAGNGGNSTSAGVTWRCYVENMEASGFSLDTDGYASSKEVDTSGPPATSGQLVSAEIRFADGTEMDSLGAGGAFRLKLERNVNDTNDTFGMDAQVVRVEVIEG